MASNDPSNRPRRRRRNQITPPEEEHEEEEEETNTVLTTTVLAVSDSDTNTDSDSDTNTDSDSNASEEESTDDDGEEVDKGDKKTKEKGKEVEEDVIARLTENLLPSCPVCMEIWTSEGTHRVCCVPCGHVYGRSCLEKWLRKCGNKIAKCPQCNRKFKLKEIINLYAPQIIVPNDDLQKEVHCLREKNESLNLEKSRLLEQIRTQREQLQDESRLKRQKMLASDYPTGRERQTSIFEYSNRTHNSSTRSFSENTATSSGRFVLENELRISGARVMCIDATSEMLIISSKAPGLSTEYMLNKISLLAPHEIGKIQVPKNMKAIKDMCILPNGLISLASLGHKLTLFSMTSNNFVLQYELPAPCWSCSGDDKNPHHIYAGLQNGKLLVFDIRQTARPIETLEGLSTHPIHTIHSLNTTTRNLLTASSLGPCLWDLDHPLKKPNLVPGLESHGICISLACGGDNMVASYRPKVDLGQPDALLSQISPSCTLSSSGKLGSHVSIKKNNENELLCKDQVCHGHVSELRMARSAIVHLDGSDSSSFFAYGDESLRGIRIWGLPSFVGYADLNPHRDPILDLRFSSGSRGPGFLGCLSEETVQIFSYR